ncbi:CMD domain-containing protein [Ancylobacter sp. VNQ12]|uniref:CMD domain-containing protein n=1 Tax=Ancylobacter sp. VNQ12 TaxID=3400920 RepID=UPI003BFD819B
MSTPDVIESVLKLDPSSPIPALRDERATLKRLTQTSYTAALRPQEPRNFPYAMRAALAARIAAAWKSDELAAHYRALLLAESPSELETQIADPAFRPAEPGRLAAVLRHVDLVTLAPKNATRADIEALKAVGLDDTDIVTLAGLIAFVNYQVLVVAGLAMLRDH